MEFTIKRLCVDCDSPVHGRIDKKFCDDHCRSHYNNRIRAKSNSMVRSINLILKRNRDILEKFNPNGKIKVNCIKLIAEGFDLHYHTHTCYTKKGGLYTFCYEQGYQKLGYDEFLLIRKV